VGRNITPGEYNCNTGSFSFSDPSKKRKGSKLFGILLIVGYSILKSYFKI